MSFTKTSKNDMQAEVLHIPRGNGWDCYNTGRIKTASIDKMKSADLGGFDISAAIDKNPDHLFVKVFAIKADEINDNGDYFSRNELKKATHTFIGVPVFVNHENENVENSRGSVVHAWYDDDKNGIYTINMVDRKAYPKLARGIEEGYILGCFPPDAPVLMSDGTEKCIADIESGDEVITHKGNVKKVLGRRQRGYNHPLYSIKLEGIKQPLICTSHHNLMTYTLTDACLCGCEESLPDLLDTRMTGRTFNRKFKQGHNARKSEQEYEHIRKVKACDLINGDFLFEPHLLDDSKDNIITEDEAFLIGLFLAEGSFEKCNGVRHAAIFSFGASELETLAFRCSELLESVFCDYHLKPTTNYYPKSSQTRINLYGKKIANWFYKWCNEYSDGKKLHPDLLRLGESKTASLLAGYVEGDGYNIKGKDYGSATVSADLSSQLRLLYAKIGIRIRYEVSYDNFNSFGYKPVYETAFGISTANKLREKLLYKQATETEYNPASWHDVEGMTLRRIEKIDEIDYNGVVYDLEIEDDHTYCVNHLAVSNSSMGAQVGHSCCSICHNLANTADDFCSHIANRKNRKFNGKHKCEYHKSSTDPSLDCPVCGCKKGSSNELMHKETQVFEYNYDINFIEDSFVVNPACHDCLVCDVLNIPVVESKVASLRETLEKLSKVNFAENGEKLEKTAGESEIVELNDAMNLLDRVARSMMAQKQNVSLEYVSDLVDVLANVQTLTDELIDMGYGQLPSPELGDMEAGTHDQASPMGDQMGDQMQDMSQMGSQSMPTGDDISPAGISSGQMPGSIGTVTKPTFSSNNVKLKKDFLKSSENTREEIVKIYNHSRWLDSLIHNRSNVVKDIDKRAEAISGEYNVLISSDDHGETHVSEIKGNSVLSVVNSDRFPEETRNLISSNPQKAAENILENLIKESDSDMNKANEKLAAGSGINEDQKETITEKQLDQQNTVAYTERQGEYCDGITESGEQLGSSSDLYKDVPTDSAQTRLGTYEFITEAQFEAVTDGMIARWEDFPEVITEKQWTDFTTAAGAILPDDWDDSITQQQLTSLREDHRWVDPGAITENQMDNQVTTVQDDHSARWSAASSDYNKRLVTAASEAIADAIANYGLSPDDVSSVNNSIFSNPRNQIKAGYLVLLNAIPRKIAERAGDISRNRYHGRSTSNIAIDAVLASLGDHVSDMSVDKFINAFNFIASDSRAMKKAESLAQEKIAASQSSFNANSVNVFKQAFDALSASDDGTYKVMASVEHDLGVSLDNKGVFVEKAGKFAMDQVGLSDLIVTNIDANNANGTFEVTLKESRALTEEEKIAHEKVASDGNEDNENNENNEDGLEEKVSSRSQARSEILRQAQLMGGQFGGQGGASQAPGAGATLPSAPGNDQPVESFETGMGEGEFDLEGESGDLLPKPPGAICPVCGSEDVDTVEGKGKCNNCGSENVVKVNVEVTKWVGLNDEEETEEPIGEGLELGEDMGMGMGQEEMPMGDEQMPVAAMTMLTPGALKKISEAKISFGSVSPLTGSTNTEKLSNNEFYCLDTGTKYSVHTALGKNKKAYAEWRWTAKPTRLSDNCPSCRRSKNVITRALKAMKMTEDQFDSLSTKEKGNILISMKEKGLLTTNKTASKNSSAIGDFKRAFNYTGDKFPLESCREKIARRYGENALALSGPCEGQKLYNCICNQLKSANVYGEDLAIKLAKVYTERDPSHTCIEDFIRDGFTIENSVFACSQLKTRYAQAIEMLSEDLDDGYSDDMSEDPVEIIDEFDGGMGDEDPFMEEDEGSIVVELPLEVIDQLESAIDIARGEDPSMENHHDDVPDGDGSMELPGEAADAIEDATEMALDTVNEVEDVIDGSEDGIADITDIVEEEGEVCPEGSEEECEGEGEEVESMHGPEGMSAMSGDEECPEHKCPNCGCSVKDDSEMPQKTYGMDGTVSDMESEYANKDKEEECCDIEKEGMPMGYAASNKIVKEAQSFKPHRIVGSHKTSLDVSGIMEALGINKEATDSAVKITPAQDDSDLGDIDDGGNATMGHEDSLNLSGPDCNEGGASAEIGNEKDTPVLDSKEILPTVPHGGAEMGCEKEQGFTAEKQDQATGGDDGAGNHRSASTKNQQNDLAERLMKTSGDTKLEPKAPVSDDEDVKPISDNSDHSKTPEGLKREPFAGSDEKEINSVPARGNSSHMGHEDDQGDVPTSPEGHPEIPVGGGSNDKYDREDRYSPEKQTRDKGTVIAEVSDEKIAERKSAAFDLAGRMLKANLIEATELSNKVDELMKYDSSQINDIGKSMFSSANKGLDTAPKGIQQPLIISETSNARTAQGELSDKLQSLFTLDQANNAASSMDEADYRRIVGR